MSTPIGISTGADILWLSLRDCVAEEPDQLMYITGDDLILLREAGDILLAACEGVVGWAKREDIRFDKLAGTSRKPSLDIPGRDDLPRTVLIAPSPPQHAATLPDEHMHIPLSATKRISGPFELDSPLQSPRLDTDNQQFFVQNVPVGSRDSMVSIASSEALGGIGGFMMGDDISEEGHDSFRRGGTEELRGTRSSQ